MSNQRSTYSAEANQITNRSWLAISLVVVLSSLLQMACKSYVDKRSCDYIIHGVKLVIQDEMKKLREGSQLISPGDLTIGVSGDSDSSSGEAVR